MTETSIAHGIEDWKRAAIAGSLAQAIYYARAEVHGWHQHWYALGDTLKHHYVDEAAALLVAPDESRSPDGDGPTARRDRSLEAVNLLSPSGDSRNEAPLQCGAGSEPADSHSLFEQVAAVARAQAAVVVGRIDPQTPWGRTDEPMEGGK